MATETFNQKVEESLTEQNNRLNNIMMVFTSIAVLFIPPQLLSGLMGMNVSIPFQDGAELDPDMDFWDVLLKYLPFISILLIGTIFSMSMLCFFKCQKLI